ncbi:MAG: ATP-binding protein [Candidatus Margulisbacteria bacterium]|jgi:predicted AAA+ superfamily ATPase|nr:ATP-binding protein [Candidatus Margulisiibacteriota bacterium]
MARKKKHRWQEENIKQALKKRRVLLLTGARQCGKTTLAQAIVSSDCEYRTLDDNSLLKMARAEPEEFIEHTKKTMIIDEVQRVPDLLLAIKKAVDVNTRYGQFLITGSADIQALPTVQESLAGRVKNIRLRPFAYGEILEQTARFFSRLRQKDFVRNTGFNKKKVIALALRGGFPEPLLLGQRDSRDWYKDYINTLIQKDLKDFAQIKRQRALRELFAVSAAYSSRYMNKDKIRAKLGLARQTVDEYLNILENIYLLDIVPAWSKTDRGRIGRQAKLYLNDTGLLAAILRWQAADVLQDSNKLGNLIETFVYNQIAAQAELSADINLYHYRDYDNHEIDLVIEHPAGLTGVEVKASSRFTEEHFKNLRWFARNYRGAKFSGIVLYTGELAMSFKDNMHLVPINNLWE